MSTEWKIPITYNLHRVNYMYWENVSLFFCVLFCMYKAFCCNSCLCKGIQIVILLLPLPLDSHYAWQRCHNRVAKSQVRIQRSHAASLNTELHTAHQELLPLDVKTLQENSWLWQQMKIFIFAGLWTETSHLGIHTRWTFLVENDGWGKLTTGKKDHNFLNYKMIDWWLLTVHSLPRCLERGSKKFCFLIGFFNKLQGKLVHHLTTNVICRRR